MKLFGCPCHYIISRPLSALAVLFMLCCGLAPVAGTGFLGLQPAPAAAATVLSFDLSARFTSKTSSGAARPARSFKTKVLTRDGRVRVESRLGGTPVVGLYAPPYTYRLLPHTKSGTRYKIRSQGDADLQALLRNPAALRSLLIKNGAKYIGAARLNNVPVEGFSSGNYRGRGEKIQVWLRKSDSLPLKLEWSDKSTQATISWNNYRKQADNASLRALFIAPSNYKIRDTTKPTALVPGLM